MTGYTLPTDCGHDPAAQSPTGIGRIGGRQMCIPCYITAQPGYRAPSTLGDAILAPATARAYRRHRADGMRARDALALARYQTAPMEWEWSGDTATLPADSTAPFTVRVTSSPDYYPDLSTDDAREDAPDTGSVRPDGAVRYWTSARGSHPRWAEDDSARYILPYGGSLDNIASYYRRSGMARHPAYARALDDLRARGHDLDGYGPEYVIVTATASLDGIALASASIGTELGDDGTRYVERELGPDLLADVIPAARDALARLARSAVVAGAILDGAR